MATPEPKTVTFLESDLPKLVISGPASPSTTFALHVTGPVRAKEVNNIIRQLNLHLEFLEEAEKEEQASTGL